MDQLKLLLEAINQSKPKKQNCNQNMTNPIAHKLVQHVQKAIEH
jgi:hypothetical protein